MITISHLNMFSCCFYFTSNHALSLLHLKLSELSPDFAIFCNNITTSSVIFLLPSFFLKAKVKICSIREDKIRHNDHIKWKFGHAETIWLSSTTQWYQDICSYYTKMSPDAAWLLHDCFVNCFLLASSHGNLSILLF